MRRVAIAAVPFVLLSVSCENRSPTEPTSSAVLDQFLQALREQGFSVGLAGEISPQTNGFFSAPAHQIRVNEAQVNAFEYPNAEAAAIEATRISPDGQPRPTARITWMSTPRFYRQGPLIVL